MRPEHVEVGVGHADRDGHALGERLLDGVLHDVVDALHRLRRCRGGVGPTRASAPVSGHAPPLLGVALRHDEALGPVLGRAP